MLFIKLIHKKVRYVFILTILYLIAPSSFSQTLTVDLFQTNVSCNGGSDGTARASASGTGTCTGPRTYNWMNASNTIIDNDSVVAGLAVGTYTVSVFDFGCFTFDKKTVTITEPAVLSMIPSVTDVVCNGATTGIAQVVPTGGTAPFTYKWSNGDADSVAQNLAAGVYTITLTDSKGCMEIGAPGVSQPSAISTTLSMTPVSCKNGTDGIANVDTIFGGTGPFYTVQWSTGSVSSTITNLQDGVYALTTTDGAGCKVTNAITVTEPGLLIVSTTSTDASCNGGNDGWAKAIPSGGNPAYTYVWSTGATLDSTGGLTAGIHTVTVKDSKSCTQPASFLISAPSAVVVNTGSVSPSCFGSSDGSITSTVSGGTPGYNYKWSTGVTSTSITGLSSGVYSLTVLDSKNCLNKNEITLIDPSSINAAPTTSNVSCNGGNDGFINVGPNGGTSPYSFKWSTGNTAQSQSNLGAGTYTITIVDANNCTGNLSITITQSPDISITLQNVKNLSCNGQQDGSVTATAIGGTGALSYKWSNNETTRQISGLDTGTYNLIVFDFYNCQDSVSATIIQPGALTTALSFQGVSCFGGNDGIATVSVSGGDSPFTFTWSSGGSSSAIATGLIADEYKVFVTDASGCSDTNTVIVTQPDSLSLTLTSDSVSCFGGNDGKATVSTSGGTKNYSYSWSSGATDSMAINLTLGNYIVTVTDAKGCIKSSSINVEEPSAIAAIGTASSLNICNGQSTTLFVSASGGDGNYSYSWNNGAGTNDTAIVSPSSTISYIITVFDGSACTGKDTVSIIVNAPLSVTASGATVTCLGVSVTLTAAGTGGDGNYTYSWDNGKDGVGVGPSITVTPDSNTTYYVTIQDGCATPSKKDSIEIKILSVNFSADTTQGCNLIQVKFNDASSNATSWLWNFGDGNTDTLQNPTHTFSLTGTYDVSLSVKTPQGCIGKMTKSSYIKIFSVPVASFNYSPEKITLVDVVSFSNSSQNSTSWLWNFGDSITIDTLQNPTHDYDLPGTYTIKLIALNSLGCSDTSTQTLNVDYDFSFFTPNAFSPNEDGVNDVFNSVGVGIKDFHISIFDKWGALIFQSGDINIGWNGQFNNSGKIVKQGIYPYRIVLSDFSDKEHVYQGYVTVIK